MPRPAALRPATRPAALAAAVLALALVPGTALAKRDHRVGGVKAKMAKKEKSVYHAHGRRVR